MISSRRKLQAALMVPAVAAVASCSSTTPQGGDSASQIAEPKRSAACAPTAKPLRSDKTKERRKITIGTAYRSSFATNDSCYKDVASTQFSSLTTEIGTMTNTLYPKPGQFNFSEADAVADLAGKNSQEFQVHSLIWDPLDQPGWKIVPDHVRNLDDRARHREMTNIITTTLKRYAGRSSAATIVNEPYDQTGKLQHNLWWQTTKSDRYIFDAFRAARMADPETKLYFNEHSIETKNGKSDAVYELLKRLRAETVRVDVDGTTKQLPLVDGIGFQAHMLGGENQQPSVEDMRKNFERFAQLGLDIRLTELDVRVPVKNGKVEEADSQRQARVYRTMLDLCVEQSKCTGVTLWGFTDRRSWITDYPETFSGYGAATPMTDHYTAKPSWQAIQSSLDQ